ncbi:MAG: DUF58 domain-containing protein [Verrucomicrobiales bacterium]
MRFKLTKLGKGFAGIALFFYLAAMSSQSMLLLALLGVVLGMFLVNYLVAQNMMSSLELRAPTKTLIPEGGKIDQPWQVTNQGKAPVHMVNVSASGERLFKVERLQENDSSFHLPELQLLKRGVYRHRDVQLTTLFPFGLLLASRRLPLEGETLVYPDLYWVKAPSASGFEPMTGGKFKGQRRSSFGSTFAGVRPWVAGDSVKQVHWKSSAKGRGLMVKMFEEELSGKVSLLICLSPDDSPTQIDDALRASGSLMFAALDDGHQLEWGVIHDPAGGINKVAPFSDGSEILESLARVHGASGEAPLRFDLLEKQLSKRSSLVVVTTALPPPLEHWLNSQVEQKRKVTLILPESSSMPADGSFETYCFSDRYVTTPCPASTTQIFA